jgi:hypothetical protein
MWSMLIEGKCTFRGMGRAHAVRHHVVGAELEEVLLLLLLLLLLLHHLHLSFPLS